MLERIFMWILGLLLLFWLLWSSIVIAAPLIAIGVLIWILNRMSPPRADS